MTQYVVTGRYGYESQNVAIRIEADSKFEASAKFVSTVLKTTDAVLHDGVYIDSVLLEGPSI